MSTSTAANETAAAVRRYRGRSVAELLPRIQAELGPDAVVVGRRSGLEGGIAGFFQRPFIELEAKPAAGGIDLHDGEQALPTPAPQERRTAPQAESTAEHRADESPNQEGPVAFAQALAAVQAALAPPSNGQAEPPSEREPLERTAEPLVPIRSDQARGPLLAQLRRQGFSEQFAAGLLERCESTLLSLAPRQSLRAAVRSALAREIPQLPLPPARHTLVVVGTGGVGKSTLIEALRDRYQRAGQLSLRTGRLLLAEGVATLRDDEGSALALDGSPRARRLLAGLQAEGVLAVEAEAVCATNNGQIKALAAPLRELGAARVVVAVPATVGGEPLARLLRALAPLAPNAVAITHAEEADQLGVVVEQACNAGLAVELLLGGGPQGHQLTPLDGPTLAERLLR